MNTPWSMVRLSLSLALLVCLPALGGCWFSHGESRSRASAATPIEPVVWPKRDMERVRAISRDTPEVLFDYLITDETLVSPETLADAELPRYRIIDNRLTEHGLLRVFEQRFDNAMDQVFTSLFEGFAANAKFVSASTLTSEEESQYWIDRLSEGRADSPGTQRTFDEYRKRIRDGVGIHIPNIDAKPSPRGIVIHYRGLISTSYEQAFVDRIRESDWLVVRIGTHTRIATPRDERSRQREIEQGDRREELMNEFRATLDPEDPRSLYAFPPIAAIYQQVSEELPTIETGFDLLDSGEADAVGREIAAAVDDAFSESAYAAEAVLEYLFEAHPELQHLPIAVLGCSAGAISAPAVAARLQERFGDRLSAIVMVGGGADLLRIDRETALKDYRRLRIFDAEDREIQSPDWQAVHESYLDAVELDPIKLGPRLREVPTLIIRAGFDKWVPASTGSELVRAFGKPDRDWHPGGHQTLFYFLEGRAPRVLRWLDRNTPQPVLETEQAATVAP